VGCRGAKRGGKDTVKYPLICGIIVTFQKPQSKPNSEIFHMVSISHDFYDEQCRSKSTLNFAKKVKLAKILEQANVCKTRGVGVLIVDDIIHF